MADYCSVTRTSSFRVTDEEKFKELLKGLFAFSPFEDDITVYTEEKDGEMWYTLYCEGDFEYRVNYEDKDSEWNMTIFNEEFQKILHPNDVYLQWTQGNEKFRFFSATALIITKDRIESLDFSDCICCKIRQLIKDDKFSMTDIM